MLWGLQGWCPRLDYPTRRQGRDYSKHRAAREPGGVLASQAAVPSPLPWGTVSRSLVAISGLESRARVFTLHVEGLLQLQVRPWAGLLSRAPRTGVSGLHCPVQSG